MQVLSALLAVVGLVNSGAVEVDNIGYGYFEKYGVPAARQIRRVEAQSRIAGGAAAETGQFPWQAGLIINVPGLEDQSVCGATLISSQSLLTAAHCYYDGILIASDIEVVLGSSTLFSGGTRVNMDSITVHQNWFPQLRRNDLAIIHLAEAVEVSDTIAPISLPSESLLEETFAGETAVAAGFGITRDGDSFTDEQVLNSVELQIIPNSDCEWWYPILVLPTSICTSGIGRVGPCTGDSGGPLVVNRNDTNILVGVSSFSLPAGCMDQIPTVYVRVSSFIDFINQNL